VAGLITTMIVGIVGTGGALYTSNKHDEQETIRAQASFTQAQQRDAYAAFYSAVNEFAEAVWAEGRLWEPSDNRGAVVRLAPPMKENLGTATNNVLTAESKVTFSGTEQIQKTADEVVQQVLNIQQKLAGFEYNHPQYPDLNDADAAEFRKIIHEIAGLLANDLQSAQAKFRDAARKDLNIPQLAGDIFNPLYGNPTGQVTAPAAAIPIPAPAVPAIPIPTSQLPIPFQPPR
jgi:hypothetical protein